VNVITPEPLPMPKPSKALPTIREIHPGIAGILATVAQQGEGNRNKVLHWGAHRLHERNIPHTDAEAMLTPIARAIGLPDAEATRTIASAYRGAR